MMVLPVLLGAHVYFVAPTGDDGADGLAPGRAWRSLARVRKAPLAPGDEIVLSGTLEGSLVLERGGTAARPIVVRAGGKTATLVSRTEPALVVRCGGVTIRNLVLKGEATAFRKGHAGIHLAAPGGGRAPRVTIEGVQVSRFGDDGLNVEGPKDSPDGFDGLIVRRSSFNDNFGAGITTGDGVAYLEKGYAHRDLRVSDCEASRNAGGTGMVFSGFDGGVVERCRARDNRGNGGGVGIWAWCARRVVFRECIASGTRTGGGDGGGFDLDGGCVDCVVEGCLTYDNDGPGYMHCDYPAAPRTQRNAIRRSVSVDDGRKAKGDSIGFGFVTWGSGLYDCVVEDNLAALDVADAGRRENGLLFLAYIRSTNDPVEKQLVRGGLFRGNRVQAAETGAAFVRNELPQRAEGDVRFEANAYEGALPFLDGGKRVEREAWRARNPQDATPGRKVDLGDVRRLTPRDLPAWLRKVGVARK